MKLDIQNGAITILAIVAIVNVLFAAIIADNLIETQDQRDILSDVIRCYADTKDTSIVNLSQEFLVDIGCDTNNLNQWSYEY